MVTDEEMKQLRGRILEIADFFDEVCKKHNIKYSVAYGTLIGAVRHGGFIPWDEDFDVVMDRNNYEKFLHVFDDEARRTSYFIRNRRRDREFNQTFTKIIDKRSEYIVEGEDNTPSDNNGVFIDIFPLDKWEKGKWNRIKMLMNGYLYKLVTRRRMRELVEKNKTAIRLYKFLFDGLLDKIEASIEKKFIKKRKYENGFYYFSPSCKEDLKHKYSAELFNAFGTIKFEDREYMIFKEYDSFLRETFGDYMQLPPVEDRVGKHRLIRVNLW